MTHKTALYYFYLPVSLLAFTYVALRALLLDVTYDEANTIIDFVPLSVMHILNHTPPSANNHILNTLLVKLFFTLGSSSLFIARLPNVLSFLLYLFFAYKIVSEFIPGKIGLFTFLLLILNPFLLDFFSLVRGYGISLGLEMASLYFLLSFFRQNHTKQLLLALAFAALSVLANLSSLNLYLALSGICGLQVLFLVKENKAKNLISLFLVTLFLGLVVWEPLRKLKESGYFWYGGSHGFYEDTLISLANYSFYSPEHNSTAKISLNIVLSILGVFFFMSFKPQILFKDTKNIFFALILLVVLSVITQFHLLGNLFIIDRSALFLYPLVMFLLGLSLQSLHKQKLALIVSMVLVFSFGFNFCLRANLYKTATWFFDAHTVQILEKINEEGRKQNRIFKLDHCWPLSYSVRYHSEIKNYPFVRVVNAESPEIKSQYDYWIHLNKPVDKSSYEPISEPILNTSKDTVLFFPEEHLYLFRRR